MLACAMSYISHNGFSQIGGIHPEVPSGQPQLDICVIAG